MCREKKCADRENMKRTVRAEVAASVTLRECEYAYQRRIARNEDAHRELEALNQSKEGMIRTLAIRERSTPITIHTPDLVGHAHVYDSLVSAHTVTSIERISRILAEAKRNLKTSQMDRTPRCVLPPSVAGCLAPLQNITLREHAVLSLLARWIMNSHPGDRDIIKASRKFDVERHHARLCTFAKSHRPSASKGTSSLFKISQ